MAGLVADGLAAAAGAVGVGRLIPELISSGATWPYTVLGTAYGLIALALMGAAAIRQRRVREALRNDEFDELSDAWVLAFTVAGMLLTAFTVILVSRGIAAGGRPGAANPLPQPCPRLPSASRRASASLFAAGPATAWCCCWPRRR